MPVVFSLDKKHLNKHGEAPIRLTWSFPGGRYQTTVGFSTLPEAWSRKSQRVTPIIANNRRGIDTTTINNRLASIEKAVNHVEKTVRNYKASLTGDIARKVIADVKREGSKRTVFELIPAWDDLIMDSACGRIRVFRGPDGKQYKLIGFGKDSETLEEVVIYKALYGTGQIWVRPYDIFFSKVTMPDGTEVERFKEIIL